MAKTKKRVVGEGIGVEIFKNRLVPKSQILNEQETQALLEKYNLSKQQLPRILAADPVARTLKAKGGDVIEFDRTNRSAGLSKYYRVVIGGA